MNGPCGFDPDRAYEHTRALCYPRRVGTAGERRAARYVLRAFAALGVPGRLERFTVSFFPAEIGARVVLAGCGLLVALGMVLVAGHPLAAAACWGVAAMLVNGPWRVAGRFGERWPPRARSANLVAAVPGAAGNAPVRVVFMAHYDTKSQLLPTGVRVGLVSGATLACGLLALVAVAAAFGVGGGWLPARPWGLGAAALACLTGLLLNVTANRSPGALDNASAVGTLLELARTWRPRPDAPADVVWVASGAEESGLDGARQFLREHAAWWQEKPTLLINLESVGAGARVFLAGEAHALRLAEDAAARLGVPHARLRVLGAAMDHQPFAAAGLSAVSILGDVVRHSFAMHSRRDHLGLIDRAALDRAGRLAAHLAWSWAERHQPLAVPAPEPPPRRTPVPVPRTALARVSAQ